MLIAVVKDLACMTDLDIDDLACRTVSKIYLDIGRYIFGDFGHWILEILDIGKLFLDSDDLACRRLSNISILENIL